MFLRSAARAVPRSSALPTSAIRSAPGPIACLNPRLQAEQQVLAPRQTRAASDHAISNPTLAGIEKRWEEMPPQEQAELWMQLRDRMKVDWHQLTLQEKKAAYWVAFGAHGPRARPAKGEGWRITAKVAQLTLTSLVLFFTIRTVFAKPGPRTMTKEWQEASNEYAKREKMNPLHGISSEGYKGKGFVQEGLNNKS